MQIFPEVYDIYKQNIPEEVQVQERFEQLPFRQSQRWQEFVEGEKAKTPKAVELRAEIEKNWRRLSDDEKRIFWEIPPHGELAISEESRNVKVVGVWDTVGALGIPDGRWKDNSSNRAQYGFHNVKLNSSRCLRSDALRVTPC
jgi:hypothetical protein